MHRLGLGLLVVAVGCAEEPDSAPAAEVPDPPVRSPKQPVEEPVEEPQEEPVVLPAPPPPPGFVLLSQAVPGAVLEVRYATADNFTGAPLPGYAPGVLWAHRRTGEALATVQASLAKQDVRLRIYDAYRPARASRAMATWAQSSGRADLLRDGYIARHSNHARGNTVDVTLESTGGEPLDMGTDWDAFSSQSHFSAARGEARTHRSMLRREMMRAGFKPYPREWWHFTLPEPSGLPRLDVPYVGE